MSLARTLLVVAVVALVAISVSAQPVLTGLAEFSADSSGNSSGGQLWNTAGPDGAWNLYVIPGPPGGAFANSGDGPSTSIAIPVPVGANTFTLHGNFSGVSVPYMGLNLFFDGDNTNPRISVFGADGVTGGTADGGTTNTLGGSGVAGANTLTFTTGVYRLTLSNFLYQGNSTGSDRVQPFDSVADQTNDNVVTFTLTVDQIEPVPTLTTAGVATLALLLAAAAPMVLRRVD